MMTSETELAYGLNELPPWPKNLLYGFQWALIFLPTLAILSAIASTHLGFQGAETVLFFQRMLIVTGTVMILQTLWGHKLPLLDGPSSALLLSFVTVAPQGLPTIQGGMIIGGIFLLFLSFFGLMRHLEALFTDNIVGVILILIAITLLPYVAPMIIQSGPGQPGDSLVFGISLVVVLSVALFSHWLTGFLKTISLLLGMVVGTALMGLAGRMALPEWGNVPWFSLPRPFFPDVPQFSLVASVSFLVAYMAVIVNGVGSIYSVGEIVGKNHMGGRVSRGIGWTGLGGLFAGASGVIGTVSFGISPGVILVTRVGTRYAVTVCGVLLVALAFFQKIMALLSSIPLSVVGAAMLTGMAAQVGAGISVLTRSGKTLTGRDYLVIGIPILLGGSVPFLPEAFFRTIPSEFQAFIKNGMIVGILAVLVLEHLFLRPKSKPPA